MHQGCWSIAVTPAYPGVNIEEIPGSVGTIAGVATSITAIGGRTRRGDHPRAMWDIAAAVPRGLSPIGPDNRPPALVMTAAEAHGEGSCLPGDKPITGHLVIFVQLACAQRVLGRVSQRLRELLR
jgi:hypothetical protein